MQLLAVEAEETNALQFRHQCLQFKHMYSNQVAIERNQVVIDTCNFNMWEQMKNLLFEQLRMFMSLEDKMDRQFNALADLYIAMASLANVDPATLLTREEMVDRLKSEPLTNKPPVPDGKPPGYYLKLLKHATTPRAFDKVNPDIAVRDALAEIRTRIDNLKMGEDFRFVQDEPPITDGTPSVPERDAENKGLFKTLLDEVLAKVTSLPMAEFDLRRKLDEIGQLRAKRHPTPAADTTCLAHPEHYDRNKDMWDQERRRVFSKEHKGMIGDFAKVTIAENRPAAESASTESLMEDWEPPTRVVRLQTDSEGSIEFVSSNKLSSKFDPKAPGPHGPHGHDMAAVKAAKKAGWYDASLVEGAPDVIDPSWNPSRPELQVPAWKVTRARGSSEEFESDNEVIAGTKKKKPVKERLGPKNVKDRLGPKKVSTKPTLGLRASGSQPVTEPPQYQVYPRPTPGTSVNTRMGTRTLPVVPRQTKQSKITDYSNH